jgi:hypothetical protein
VRNVLGILRRIERYFAINVRHAIRMKNEINGKTLALNPLYRFGRGVKSVDYESKPFNQCHVEGGIFANAHRVDHRMPANAFERNIPSAVRRTKALPAHLGVGPHEEVLPNESSERTPAGTD